MQHNLQKCSKWKKTDEEDYMLYDFFYMKYSDKVNL